MPDSNQPLDLNLLFKTWLTEETEALANKRSRMCQAYKKAADNLSSVSEPITTPKQLKSVPYIGDKIFHILCSRLQKHCEQNSVETPISFANYVSTLQNGKRRLEVDQDRVTKQRRQSKWLPKRRSGGWAILIALCKHKNGPGLCKEELIAAATPYCDSSFTSNPAARDFYSAWDGIKTLISHDFVSCRGRPKIYLITETGVPIAEAIMQQEGLQEEPTVFADPEISFDNGIRATPDTSLRGGLLVVDPATSPLRHKVSNEDLTHSPILSPSISTISNNLPNVIDTNKSSRKIHDIENKTYGGIKYDIWCPDEYEIILIMDNREVRSQLERDYFQTRILSSGINCKVRNLSAGDVLWIARHKKTGLEVVLNHICERKRLDDLAMSIRDGRFTEQKSRLRNSGLKHIYYLVEEGGLGDIQRILDMKQAIETSISMVMTNSKFFLNRFKRTDDTIEWLQTMTDILIRKHEGLRLIVLKPNCVETRDEYILMLNDFRDNFESNKCTYECVHKYSLFQASMTKTTMMTVKEMFISMLMLIRGMSLEKAVVMQNHFQVPRNLIEYFLEHGAGKTEHEKGVLIMDLFQNEMGSKKYNKPLLIAVYQTWGKE